MKRTVTLLLFTLLAIFYHQKIAAQCNTTVCTALPPPSLCAEEACVMCDPCYLDGLVGQTSPAPNTCDVPGPFCGSVENNVWYAFMAPPSGTVTFNFTVMVCQGTGSGSGIQAEIYATTDCNGFVSVSNCWSPGSQQNGSVTANNLIPYCTYYLMIDGWAGDVCTYTINTTDCTTPPTQEPVSISGPSSVCPGATVTYTMDPAPVNACGNNSNAIVWGGILPYGQIIGPSDESTITVQWLSPGVTNLTVSYNNICFGGSSSPPFPVSIQPIPPTNVSENVCLGECWTCAGQLICSPGLWPVTLQNWLGCDSLVNCIYNPILPIPPVSLVVTQCAPFSMNICGQTFNTCGIHSGTCDNWQGCDSITVVDLAILNPKAEVVPPGVLNCTPGATITLDGSASTLGSSCAPNVATAYSWTGPPGGINGPANGPTVTIDEPGQYCLTVTHSRGGVSCTNTKCVTVLKDNNVPQTPQISGPNNPCPNTQVTYTVTPVGSPAPTGYTWTTSNGTPVSNPNPNTAIVTWTAGGPVQICVTANNDCGSSSPACLNVNVATPPTATISGAGSVCPNSNGSVNLTITLTGVGPWTVGYSINNVPQTPPLTITSSPYTLVASQVGTYTLTSVTGGAGCTGNVSGSATVSEFPVPTATLSGSGSICQGSGQTANLSIALTGSPPWTVNWAVNGNNQAAITNIMASPYTLPIGQAQAGNVTLVSVTDGNGCTGTVGGAGTVTVNTAPTVSNVQTNCDANNVFYTVIFTINGGNPATYSVIPNNGTLTGNVFTSNQILSGTGYSFIVNDANNCNPVTVSEALVICDCETSAGDMDVTLIEVCGNGPVTAPYDNSTQVFDGNDSLVFILHSGSGVNIVPPVLGTLVTPTVSFNAANMSYGVTYYLSAVVGDDNGNLSVDLNDPCLDVAQGTPIVFYQIPTANLQGDPAVCEGDMANLTVSFTGTGPWSITYDAGSGPQTVNGITGNPYTLSVSPATSTTVCLTGMSDVNCPGTASGCGNITVNQGVQASATTTCDPGGTFYNVTITISGGDPASYFVTPLNGTLTGNIFTSDNIPDGMGYLFTVDDANGCAPQTVQATEVLCDCTTDVGTMTSPSFDECGNGPVTATYDATGEVLDPDDVKGFILHTNPGNNPGTVIAYNTAPTFSFNPATMTYGTTYYISAVVGNNDGNGQVDLSDACLALAQGTPVTFYEIPTATISGDASLCLGGSTELSVTLTGKQPWEVNVNGQIFSNITSPDFVFNVSPTATTVYTISNIIDANCIGTGSGSATVQINQAPVILNQDASCIPDTNVYTVTFNISGGNPATYTVLPAGSGTLTGNTFTSNPIESLVPYTFTVDDANGCGPDQITGVLDCNCISDAGTMSLTPKKACQNEGIAVTATTGAVLDGDDLLRYYLHTGSGNQLGTVIAVNTLPGFNFNPATMQTGVTYYISAVVGTNNGSGSIDLSDFCLDVAPGTPVLWNPLPTVTLIGTDAVCEGGVAQATFTMNGVGPYNISYSINGSPQSSAGVPSPFTLQLTPTATTTIQMIAVTDLGAGCSSPSSESTTILVSQNVGAGTPAGDFVFCDDVATTVNLADNLTGADPGGIWTDPAGSPVTGGMVNLSALTPGTYTYTYTVAADPPCFDDQASVKVVIHPLPVANAGPDQETDCDLSEVTLGGSNTTPGMQYQWTGGPVSNASIPNPTASEPGTYTLTVTNPATGCSATDAAVISQTITSPIPHVRVSGVSCFGKKDGFILVDSVTNGLAPYLFSFDGSAFGTNSQFTNLSPGNHTLIVMDAAGCERQLDFYVQEPEEVNVELVLQLEGNDSIITLGDSVKLVVVVSPPWDSLDAVIWTPENAVPCDTCQENWISPSVQTTFSIKVDKNGCTDEDKLTVYVRKIRPVYVPNAFSPNNDGTNDQFLIYAGTQVTNIRSFLVFNRWGETVYEYYNFQPNDPAFGWDGKHRGKEMDPAVFTWFAEIEFIDGKVEIFEGDVTLMR